MCNVPKDQLDDLQGDFKMKSSQTLMKKVLAAAFEGNLDSNSEQSDGEDKQDNHQWIGKTFEKTFGVDVFEGTVTGTISPQVPKK